MNTIKKMFATGALLVAASLAACSSSSADGSAQEPRHIQDLETICLEPTIEGDEDTGAIALFNLDTEGEREDVIAEVKRQTVVALEEAISECPDYTFAEVVVNAATTSFDSKPVVSLVYERSSLESGIPDAENVWDAANESDIHKDLR